MANVLLPLKKILASLFVHTALVLVQGSGEPLSRKPADCIWSIGYLIFLDEPRTWVLLRSIACTQVTQGCLLSVFHPLLAFRIQMRERWLVWQTYARLGQPEPLALPALIQNPFGNRCQCKLCKQGHVALARGGTMINVQAD